MGMQAPVPQFLLDADVAVAQEFGRIALDRIVKVEAGTRGFAKAAKVLQVTVDEVEQAVAALTALLAHAVRLHLQHPDLLSLLSDAGMALKSSIPPMLLNMAQLSYCVVNLLCTVFNTSHRSMSATVVALNGFEESCCQALADMFAQRHEELYGVVALSGTSYSRLNWRLDIQVASRSVRQQASPQYLLALKTSAGLKHIEADYSVLKEVCLQLEAALAEARSTRSRRFLRVFNS